MLENNCVDDSFPTVLHVFLTSNCTETEFLYPFRILELNLLSFSGVMSFLQYFVKDPLPTTQIQILSLIRWWRASLFAPRTNRTKFYDKLSSLGFIFLSSSLSWLKLCFILLQIFFFWGGGGLLCFHHLAAQCRRYTVYSSYKALCALWNLPWDSSLRVPSSLICEYT